MNSASPENAFKCPGCNRSFEKKGKLLSDKIVDRFSCDECGKRFYYKTYSRRIWTLRGRVSINAQCYLQAKRALDGGFG